MKLNLITNLNYQHSEADTVVEKPPAVLPDTQADDQGTVRRVTPKVGRNEDCPCGSGKKYKHCCGKLN